MASKTTDRFLENLSPETRAALEKTRQNLQENNVQLKADSYDPQTPPRQAEQTRTTEPKLNETVFPQQHTKAGQHQRGADFIQQKREETKEKETAKDTTAEKGKDHDKHSSAQTQKIER